jgi:hypothetical protein
VLIEYYEISARSNKQAMLGFDPRVALGVAHVTDQQGDKSKDFIFPPQSADPTKESIHFHSRTPHTTSHNTQHHTTSTTNPNPNPLSISSSTAPSSISLSTSPALLVVVGAGGSLFAN